MGLPRGVPNAQPFRVPKGLEAQRGSPSGRRGGVPPMSEASASPPRQPRNVRGAFVTVILGLFAACLFLGAVFLGAAVLLVLGTPDIALPVPVRIATDATLAPWLGGAGVIAAVWAFFVSVSVVVGVLKPRDALSWGGVTLVAGIAIYAMTGLLLASLAGIVAALLAVAGVGPITAPLPPKPRYSQLSVVMAREPERPMLPEAWPLEVQEPEPELTAAGTSRRT